MSKIKRKLLYLILAIIILGIGLLLYKVKTVVPSVQKFTIFGTANEFYFYEKNMYYKNHEVIQKYFDITKDKYVQRTPYKKAQIASKVIHNYIYYSTEADTEILKLVSQIKNDIGSSK